MALINRPRTKGGNAHSGSSIHQKDNRNKVNTAHSLSAQQPTRKNKACKYFISKKFKSSLFRVRFCVTEERTLHEATECKLREKSWIGETSFRPHSFIWQTGTRYIVTYISHMLYQRHVVKTQYVLTYLFFPPHIPLVDSVEMVSYLPNVMAKN